MQTHVNAADQTRQAATSRSRPAPWLEGRRLYFIGGCELTYVKEYFEARGAVTYHTFDHQRPSDPFTETADPDSPLWAFAPDYVVLAQVQVASGLFHRLQWAGPSLDRSEQEADLDAIVGSFGVAADAVHARLAVPVVLMTHPIVHRPTYGLLEQRSLGETLSLAELIRRYELAVYDMARERDDTYVLDLGLALADDGVASGLRGATELLGEHLTREGGAAVAARLERLLWALDGRSRKIKCAVFDLDNTLWSGVLREDGVEGVQVRTVTLRAMKYLAARGVLLALCSKNDPVEAELLPGLLGADLHGAIVSAVLSWDPKSQGLRQIAEELNIGLDSLAFFDDNPRERAEVEMNAPEVLVLSDADILSSLTMPEFEPGPTITGEAQRRAEQYREQAARKRAERSLAGGDHDQADAFLHSLELRLELRPVQPAELARVAELLERTNQLNATTRRTSFAELRAAIDRGEVAVHIANLEDRFGDYGLIGAAVVRLDGEWLDLEEFALSCRAMGRGVEQAMSRYLVEQLPDGAGGLRLEFRETPRNGQLRKILGEIGFVGRPSGEAEELTLDWRSSVAVPNWLSIDPTPTRTPLPGLGEGLTVGLGKDFGEGMPP
ncbi:MAG: HAD-IIIC family phosphatase [Acidimicrobiales bacterium]|nr:HAD-IIIC family phosphatase [Acidimicrobiales bacterium]